ncbi:MAG: DUF551 domain-containing protein [Enterobacter sichuanensis]|uniref:DUF551 domain-containing protein n=1 Tax=Enterobacter sichuanensis TaxID=2071710 RepID=UPI00290E7792|nr:DUF551 domain-containing protein [Enterobacter sichuanensis]MDU5349155.1 DUF551 domain-containing protein [Enterobacter sichuanensis]MDU5389719.1 DUF551 domain-containing protein [Enterobacter sichuanensis]
MSTITKERAQEIFLGNGPEPTASEERELARIALASLEAEPVGEVSEQRDGLVMDGTVDLGGASTHRIIKGASKMKRLPLGTKFYTAPPAPVALPSGYSDFEEIWSSSTHPLTQDDEMKDFAWDIWNACRAAMLQRAEPVQGWIPCSDRMPTKNHRVLIFINFNSDTVPPSIHDAQFTGSTFRRGNATVNVFPLEDGYGVTHWMPLPAAPQQEA